MTTNVFLVSYDTFKSIENTSLNDNKSRQNMINDLDYGGTKFHV